jgi:hypothetical protein
MTNCMNVAFNGKGEIAILVGYNNQFIVLEIGRN